jgi:hypothetical protein
MSTAMNASLSSLILLAALILSGCTSNNMGPDVVESPPVNTVAKSDSSSGLQDVNPNSTLPGIVEVAATPSESTDCRGAAAAAERENELPKGLLTAIAGAESGMHSTALRVAGHGVYPATQQAARSIARRALSRSQSVMAGCMQVNLQVHDPKGELWALEPDKAANWAADYLTSLHDRLGSWRSAIKVYGGGGGRSYVRRIERRLDAGLPDEVAEAP